MAGSTQRLDKWLWFARIVKTRWLARTLVSQGAVRVNRHRIAKPSHPVVPGDVLTLAVHGQIRVLRILDAGVRRGPAVQARRLYEELTTPPPSAAPDTSNQED